MKKSSKKILISCLSVLPVIPTVALLTSCKSNETVQIPDAKWTAEFDSVKVFTGVTDAQDLKNKMQNNPTIDGKPMLQKICIPLRISVPSNQDVQLVTNTLKEINNNLYFNIQIGRKNDLDSKNVLYIKEYSCAIKNLTNKQNNTFDNQLISNSIVSDNNITNTIANAISIPEKQEVSSKVQTSNLFESAPITQNSSIVVNELSSLEKTYTLTDTTDGQKSSLSSDLEYLIKRIFINNFDKWMTPAVVYKDFLPFSNIQITPAQKNKVNIDLIFQIKNSSNKNQIFSFLSNNVDLAKNDILTVNISSKNITSENILTVDNTGNICFSIPNTTIKYVKNSQNPTTLENQTLTQKSYSINKKFNNIASNNNPFNPTTNEKFNEILNQSNSSFTFENIKEVAQTQIQNEFDRKKELAFINLEVIEKFAIPAIKTPDQYGNFDVDKNKIYSLYDLVANLGKPLGQWYRYSGLEDAAIIIENLFSGEPLYRTFRNMFPTLVKLLRGLNITVINDIVDFLEESLTINGKPKTEAQFKDFFVNIGNLKEVVKPLLQNGGAFTGYQIYLVLELIDTLSSPIEQSLWQWVSNNFGKVIRVVNTLLSAPVLDQNIKNLLTAIHNGSINDIIANVSSILPLILYTVANLGNISVDYKDQTNVNWLMDVDLYDLFERKNGLKINNPPYILQAIFPQSRDYDALIKKYLGIIQNVLNFVRGLTPGTIDLALGAIGGVPNIPQPIKDFVKNNKKLIRTLLLTLRNVKIDLNKIDIVFSSLTIIFKQVTRFLSGWPNLTNMNGIWSKAFKSYFVPKTIDGQENTENKTILEIFRERDKENKLYNVQNFNWSELSNITNTKSFSLNHKLIFDVEIPNLEYNVCSVTNNSGNFTENPAVTKTINNINAEYFFSNSTPIPVVNKNDLSVSWKLAYFKKYTGFDDYIFNLNSETLTNGYLESNQTLAKNQTYFSDYEENIFDDNSCLETSKFNNIWGKPTLIIKKKDLIRLDNNDLNSNIYFLAPTAFNNLLNDMFNKSNKINFNFVALKPNIYVEVNGDKGNVFLTSPTKFYEKSKAFFKDNVSFEVKIQ